MGVFAGTSCHALPALVAADLFGSPLLSADLTGAVRICIRSSGGQKARAK